MTKKKTTLFTPVKAYVPINLGSIEELVKGTDLKPDRVRAIFHQFYLHRLNDSTVKKTVESQKFQNGWVSLNAERVLRKVVGWDYNKYVLFLEERSLLLVRRDHVSNAKKYTRNGDSVQYKIPNSLLSSPSTVRHFRKEFITDYFTLKAIHKLKKRIKETILSKKHKELMVIHERLSEMVALVNFDLVGASKFLQNVKDGVITVKADIEEKKQRNFGEMLLLMDSFNEGEYVRYCVDTFGERFHTPLTNLWGELRKFMFFKDQPDSKLISLDLSNSQPYFSSIVTNVSALTKVLPEYAVVVEELKKYEDKEDFKKFANLCASGGLYKDWMAVRGLTSKKMAQKEIFMVMFGKVRRFNGKGQSANILRDFIKHYPSVYNCFIKIKSLNESQVPFIKDVFVDRNGVFEGSKSYHKSLACMMQRFESRVILQRVAPKLIAAGIGPFVTVHDAFILPEQFAETAKQILSNEFTVLGVTPPNIKKDEL